MPSILPKSEISFVSLHIRFSSLFRKIDYNAKGLKMCILTYIIEVIIPQINSEKIENARR